MLKVEKKDKTGSGKLHAASSFEPVCMRYVPL